MTILKYLLVLLLVPFALISQEKQVVAKIKIIQKDNLVNVYANAMNHTHSNYEDLNYTLLTLKEDVNGNLSKNQQSGKFSILSNKTKLLSKLQLNISDKGNIKIFLYIRNKKKLLSKDKVEITLIDKKYSSDKIAEENIELSGLVVENVMTKLGKDFYDYFNQVNQLNGIQYPFIILIDEKPSIGGRNSEINIIINDKTIYKFRTQPKEKFLYHQAKEANKYIYKYHLKQKLLKNKIRTF